MKKTSGQLKNSYETDGLFVMKPFLHYTSGKQDVV